jgi:diguanylate cyclase (GGDEF)-like protein/PAS domain S-box-containing protein
MTEQRPKPPERRERRATEAALAASFRAVFDAIGEAFCVLEIVVDDAGAPVDYRFVEVNRAFEEHTGLSEVVGKTARMLVPDLEPNWLETYAEVARSQSPTQFVDEVRALRRWFAVYAWPLGRPTARRVAVHFTDITERKNADDELLRRSKQFYELVQRAPIGVYVLDGDLRIIETNANAHTLFGDQEVRGRDHAEVLRKLWPPDQVDVVVQIARSTLESGAPHYEPEMTWRHDDGSEAYFEWRTHRVRLPDRADGVVCYFTDITKQVRARLELTESESRYRTLFESIEEGFCILEVVFDEDDRPIDYRYLETNPSFLRHTGLHDAVGRTINEMVPGMEAFWFDAYGGVALTGKPTSFVAHAEAMERWYDVSAFRIGEPEERKVAVLFADVTAQKRAELALQESVELLRHHAHHDPLTGLPNRLQFEVDLNDAVAAADRHGQPFALLFLDLDGFKVVNDDHGHAAGDVVLIEIARRLRRSLRVNDKVARIHGDEFVFLLPEISEPHEAASIARKLLGIVGGPIAVAGTTVRVHASIGVSLYPNDGANARALLRAADTAMYAAKQGGKNAVRYVVAPKDGGSPS